MKKRCLIVAQFRYEYEMICFLMHHNCLNKKYPRHSPRVIFMMILFIVCQSKFINNIKCQGQKHSDDTGKNHTF